MQSKDEHSESAACGSVGVPRVIRFAYKDFMEANGKWIASGMQNVQEDIDGQDWSELILHKVRILSVIL